jgi:hypothetical protein
MLRSVLLLVLLLASNLSLAINPYTLLLRQYDDTGANQLAIPVEAPYASAYLWYNPATNIPEWGLASAVSMSATQISDTTSVGRDVMSAVNAAAARSAIGCGTSNFSGAYGDLTGSPTNLNQFTNGPGFVTASTAPVTSVNGFTGGVTLTAASVGAATSSHTHTASQISDSTTIGRSILTASNQAAVQAIVGSAQVNSDWSSTSGPSQILNKPAKYSGNTNGSGVYSVTYGSAYSVKPHVIFSVEGGTNKDTAVLTSTTTTGFSIIVERRTDIAGLLPTYAAVSGLTVNVLVTP